MQFSIQNHRSTSTLYLDVVALALRILEHSMVIEENNLPRVHMYWSMSYCSTAYWTLTNDFVLLQYHSTWYFFPHPERIVYY